MKKNYVTLEEVCVKGSSNIAQKDLENNEGRYPIYGASGFIKNVDFYAQDKPYIAVVKDGAGIGRTMMLPAHSSVIGTMQYLLPKDNIDISYLYYAVTAMNLAKYYTGATIPHIYFKDYRKEKLPVVDKIEQKKIVEVLSKIDALVIYHKRQLDDFEVLLKSRFMEMFGDRNFSEVKAADICDFITKGTTPNANDIYEDFSEGRIPYIKVYNLSNNGQMLFDERPQFIGTGVHEGLLKRSKVYPGDVLMNIVGPPLGKFAIVPKEYGEWNINQAIAIFRPKEKIRPIYLLYALMQPDILKPFLHRAVGIRQLNLSLEQCRELIIKLPPIDLQNQFADFVEQVNKSKFTHCYELLLLIIKKIWYNNYV